MLRNVPFWIILSGHVLIPSRGAGVSEEAFLLHADPRPHPSLLDRVRGACDAWRADAGRHRIGDPLGPDDGAKVGRAEESRTLDAWAASPAAVLIVTGIAGIGKSTLVASWLVRQRPRPYIYWFEVHDGTTRAVFLRDLAAFLSRLGRRGLKNLLEETRAEDPNVTARVLAHDLRDVPILLVLDNFQRAAPELALFIAGPVVDLGAKASAKILLISRTNPAALVRRKGSNGFRVEVLRVGGLDHTASVGLLRSEGLAGDDTALERAASSARGHPILSSFAAQTE